MTETNDKIHVLDDETLGGIKREYVEVDRKAEVGEKIVIVEKDDLEEGYENGDVFTVDRHRPGKSHVESDEARCGGNIDGFILREEYHVLEPTDIVHIDGRRYELTDRKAEVGEKIIHLYEGESSGIAREVRKTDDEGVEVDPYEDEEGVWIGLDHGYYRVLVPVEAAEEEPHPSDPIDVIASLAQEVAELKRTVSRITDNLGWDEMGPGRIANLRNDVSDIKRDIASLEEQVDQNCAENEEAYDYLYEEMKRKVSDLETTVERHERVNDRHRDEIDTLYKDKRTLGEELARLAAEVGKETESSAKVMAEAFVALRRAGL
ncbi:hypothetical protein BSF20_19235 [Bacillus amyloliquefaciens]|uniref:hypothetical protein n=1 Tax=Bacillus amyloliquefaciens TaxID=1390 RepID=UPI00090A86D6|nr:hypothetical protein [Bacillus amyloliquefaciens]APH50432.1 hypothetical protein BSF20_19235 [Bacillus amyloliquefaciens]